MKKLLSKLSAFNFIFKHYDVDSFSKNRKPTMSAKDARKKISPSKTLTAIDIQEIQTLYDCKGIDPIKKKLTQLKYDGYLTVEPNKFFKHVQYKVADFECEKECEKEEKCAIFTYITRFKTCLLYTDRETQFYKYKLQKNIATFVSKFSTRFYG